MAAIRDFRPTDTDAEAAADAVDLAKRHLVQPWPFAGSIGTEARSLIGSGDGIYLIDGDGKRLIDGPAGMWCVNVGHRREELASVMYEQAMQLSYNTPWYTMNGPSAELARRIAASAPGDLSHDILHHRRIVGGRDRAAFHAVLQQRPRTAGEEADPVPRRRISRLDLPVGLAQRAAARSRLDGRRGRPHRQAVVAKSLPQTAGHERRSFWRFPGRRVPGDGDAHRRGQDRRLRRRAGPGIRRRDRAAGRLPEAHQKDLPRQRHPLHFRRGSHRLRTAWFCLRVGGFVRRRSGHDHLCQGRHVRLLPARRRHCFGAPAGRTSPLEPSRRDVRPWPDLHKPPGRLRGGAQESRPARGRSARPCAWLSRPISRRG